MRPLLGLLLLCAFEICPQMAAEEAAVEGPADREPLSSVLQSARDGNAEAQFRLGWMYATGQGVAENYAEAVRWYRLAAQQGQARGQNGLGVMYEHGFGVSENYVMAFAWYNLAAAQGEENAVENKHRIRQTMTPAQIQQAQELSTSLLLDADD